MVAQSQGIAKTQPWQGRHDSDANHGKRMTAGLKITLMVNRGTPRTVELGASALVGSGRAADLRVPDLALAPLHLRLLRDGDDVTAIALAPGVILDGAELAVDEVHVVTGHTLEVGPLTIVAERIETNALTSRGRTESLAREIVRDLMGGGATDELAPELVVETGPAAGQRLPLPQLDVRVVVGRGESATWVLLDPDLSRSHAGVERKSDGVWVHDLGSKNGTRVAGKLVGGAPGVLLEDGAVIGLGDTQLRFIDPAAAMLAELEGRMAAASSGAHGAITLTRPGHVRAVVAVPTPRPSQDPRPPRAVRLGVAVAALVAVAAVVLLVALLLTS
jgi:hypothetical protein